MNHLILIIFNIAFLATILIIILLSHTHKLDSIQFLIRIVLNILSHLYPFLVKFLKILLTKSIVRIEAVDINNAMVKLKRYADESVDI